MFDGYLPANVEFSLINLRKLVDFEYLNVGTIMSIIK
jgi:hypothetical protein